MAESPMGKSVCLHKKIIFSACLCALLFLGPVKAAAEEYDLFQKAYEYYLSYRPEKALEYFDLLLKEFPGSSAKDAVLFWKAKALMNLGRSDEALGILRDFERTFPASPFIPFVEKELAPQKKASQ